MNILHVLSPAYAANLRHEALSPCGLIARSRAVMPSSAVDAASKPQHNGFCAPFFGATLVRAFVVFAPPVRLDTICFDN